MPRVSEENKTSVKPSSLAPWVQPELRRLDAERAESNSGINFDANLSLS